MQAMFIKKKIQLFALQTKLGTEADSSNKPESDVQCNDFLNADSNTN